MARVVHFEMFPTDTKKAVEFYRQVFGWEIETWQGPFEYWLATTGPDGTVGINGAISAPGSGGSQSVINTIGVDDLDATIERIIAAGGVQISEKNEIAGVGWFAYLQDPTGIVFGVLQPAPGSMP